jgi:hypothetical protein
MRAALIMGWHKWLPRMAGCLRKHGRIELLRRWQTMRDQSFISGALSIAAMRPARRRTRRAGLFFAPPSPQRQRSLPSAEYCGSLMPHEGRRCHPKAGIDQLFKELSNDESRNAHARNAPDPAYPAALRRRHAQVDHHPLGGSAGGDPRLLRRNCHLRVHCATRGRRRAVRSPSRHPTRGRRNSATRRTDEAARGRSPPAS